MTPRPFDEPSEPDPHPNRGQTGPDELLRLALDCLLPVDFRLEPALDRLERRQ